MTHESGGEMSEKMHAVTSRTYGGPEVMSVEEIDRPTPGRNEVLVKVAASSVNPYDWHFLRGLPFFIRFAGSGFPNPKHPVLGADLSGTIVAAGEGVAEYQIGDEVFGELESGCWAEYAIAPCDKITLKPENVSHIDAGVVGIAGLTALQAVRDWAQVQKGQSVLINGASGGVGTYAVQIAKYWGAEVTAVCSGRNVELVRELGADHVIDYQKQDFVERANTYDVIIDMAANRSIKDIKMAMAPRSKWVLVGYNFKTMLMSGLFGRWLFSDSGKEFVMKVAEVNSGDLKALGELLANGTIRSSIDRTYSLKETPIAVEYVETMRACGKVAIEVK